MSQCLDVDVASQGKTKEEALANLREAIELYLEPPLPTRVHEFARLRLGRLEPQSFREIKRRLENAGFVEVSQRDSHVKFVRDVAGMVDIAIVPRNPKFR